ncbi:uncharacterized protein TNCT_428941 [Trichonephila clavata]|uniref:Uncharacterized protein n=1 Tax=Trichonephila clavata TaxID=2740835 RepID=A0A8X6FQ38_TRICU|nr:uncharacterized protein TNCT_428941 [Trichonephila clavata]
MASDWLQVSNFAKLKNESAVLLKQKDFHTIAELSNSAKHQIIANTDGSVDSDLDKGGIGIYFIHPIGELKSYRIFKDKISSNFKSELMVIKRALDNYHKREIESSVAHSNVLDSSTDSGYSCTEKTE